jgi:hypothetical protein
MDYTSLLTSVENWSLRSDAATVAEIPTFIEFAEHSFNHGIPERGIAPLRVREMLVTDDIPMTDGVGTIPTDYLQYLSAQSVASTPRPLAYSAPVYNEYAFADGAAGLSNSFYINASSLYVYPLSDSDVRLTYYGKIPALSVSNTTNWLVEKMPSIYLHGALLQLALFTKDNELLARSQAMVAAGIDGLNMTDTLGRYAQTGSRMRMITP